MNKRKQTVMDIGSTVVKRCDAELRVVLVGLSGSNRVADMPGYYAYRVTRDDKITEEDAKRINEIWLFDDALESNTYRAEFLGMKTGKELVKDYGYPAKGKAHGGKYLLFKTMTRYPFVAEDALGEVGKVIVRLKDFSHSPNVRKQLKAFLESPERNDPSLLNRLPNMITVLHPEQLCVCEGAIQMDLFDAIVQDTVKQYAKPQQASYRIVSLFSGCGGLDLGFVGGFNFLGREFGRNNFDIVWANELNPNACKTYERNFGTHIVCGDITDAIKSMPTDVDVVMGGFPCQDISINGKMLGIKGKRSGLYSYIVEAVKRCRPKVFLAENVGSLMLRQNEYSFKTILSDFESLDYHVTYKVYHAEQYGVPQTRERVIFVGTRKDLPRFTPPEPVSGRPITCGEALRDLECMSADKEFSHIWSRAAPSGEQGSRKMVEDRPGYTIRAECHGNIQFHYRLPRRLSMREAARIQSFPDSFVFPCGIRETERQIGNAVPPVLAWYIAREVQKVLEVTK